MNKINTLFSPIKPKKSGLFLKNQKGGKMVAR